MEEVTERSPSVRARSQTGKHTVHRDVDSTKRQKIKHTNIGRRFSKLEMLPTELLEMIFSYHPNPALPQSSPLIGRALSSRAMLLNVCTMLWDEECPFGKKVTAFEPRAVENTPLKQAFLNRPWFDLQFIKDLQHALGNPCNQTAGCQHPITRRQNLNVVDEEIMTMRQFLDAAKLDFNPWADCSIPPRLLCGPWTPEKIELLTYLQSELHLYIRLNVGPDALAAATRGAMECIAEGNWFVLKSLLDLPGSTLPMTFLDDPLNVHPDFIARVGYELSHRRRFNLNRYPYTERLMTGNCRKMPHVRASQAMIRSAVLQHGCHRGIVGLILAHSLYDLESIDYLDPPLWTWAEVNGSKGVWLTGMLRLVSAFAERIARWRIPDQRNRPSNVWDINTLWRDLQGLTDIVEWEEDQESLCDTDSETQSSHAEDVSEVSENCRDCSLSDDKINSSVPDRSLSRSLALDDLCYLPSDSEDDSSWEVSSATSSTTSSLASLSSSASIDSVESTRNPFRHWRALRAPLPDDDSDPPEDNIQIVHIYVALKILEIRWHVNMYSCASHYSAPDEVGDDDRAIAIRRERYSNKRLPARQSK